MTGRIRISSRFYFETCVCFDSALVSTLQSELSRENYFLFTMNRLGKLFSINYDSISSSPVC